MGTRQQIWCYWATSKPRDITCNLWGDWLLSSKLYSHQRQRIILSRLTKRIQEGWPTIKPDSQELDSFWHQKDSLFIQAVVVLQAHQSTVIESLHAFHWGVINTKQLARRYIWWPSLNADIEIMVKECDICTQCSRSPPQHYTGWPKTDKPWERAHIDFAGPLIGEIWRLCVDAHSKYPYAGIMEIGQTHVVFQ